MAKRAPAYKGLSRREIAERVYGAVTPEGERVMPLRQAATIGRSLGLMPAAERQRYVERQILKRPEAPMSKVLAQLRVPKTTARLERELKAQIAKGPAGAAAPAPAAAPKRTTTPAPLGFPSYLGGTGEVRPPMSLGGAQRAAQKAAAGGGAALPGQLPEQRALAELAKIDPAAAALRARLGAGYGATLTQAEKLTPELLQTYLTREATLDPAAAAGRAALESQIYGDVALGAQLDPATLREIQQQVRAAEAARGNVRGVAPAALEAMTTGQAGLALRQQRQQAALQYLQSGQSASDRARALFGQEQAYLQNVRQQALGYLGSGQTAYDVGSRYLQGAEAAAAAAAAGGVAAPGYGGAPIYGGLPASGYSPQALANQFSQGTLGYLQAGVGGTAGSPNRTAGALTGALGGAASGAAAGAAFGGWGAIPGAIIGGVMGGAAGGM
jgi:hypothetical protein